MENPIGERKENWMGAGMALLRRALREELKLYQGKEGITLYKTTQEKYLFLHQLDKEAAAQVSGRIGFVTLWQGV